MGGRVLQLALTSEAILLAAIARSGLTESGGTI